MEKVGVYLSPGSITLERITNFQSEEHHQVSTFTSLYQVSVGPLAEFEYLGSKRFIPAANASAPARNTSKET